jgi:hypothetical protein
MRETFCISFLEWINLFFSLQIVFIYDLSTWSLNCSKQFNSSSIFVFWFFFSKNFTEIYNRKKLRNVFFKIFYVLEGWKRNVRGGKINFHGFLPMGQFTRSSTSLQFMVLLCTCRCLYNLVGIRFPTVTARRCNRSQPSDCNRLSRSF